MTRLEKLVFGSFAVLLAIGFIAVPASAQSDDVDDARAAIEATAQQAIEDIEQVVADFESAAGEMDTQSEVNAAATTAQTEVSAVAQEAIAQINRIQSQHPSLLAQVAGSERTRIQEAKRDAFDEIKAIKETHPTPETTTDSPEMTTTTLPQETTTTTESESQSATPTSPTQPPSPDPIPNVSETDIGSPTQPADPAVEGPIATLTPRLQLNMEALDGTGDGGEIQFAGLRLVLPPAITVFIATPIEIIKLLLRTTLDGGRILFLPISLLIGSCGLLLLLDRRRQDPLDTARM